MSVDNVVSVRDIRSPLAYLGKGMYWPPQEDPVTGDFKKANLEESVRVCVLHIIETYVGSYPVLREFGTLVEALLFEVQAGAGIDAIASSVKDGLTRFERRVEFVNVNLRVEPNSSGTQSAFMEVRYRVVATGRVETGVIDVTTSQEGSDL